jgi:hypothetical protein
LVPVSLPFSEAGTLLTLNSLDSSVYVPFGRSYDGNSWERVAGLEETLDYICEDAVLSGHCEVDLSFTNDSTDYYLTKYSHSPNWLGFYSKVLLSVQQQPKSTVGAAAVGL